MWTNTNQKPRCDEGQTFFNFFIFEGGHRPFFLILRLRRSRFLRSLTFFASFIFIFCSILCCIFDSNGKFSTGTASTSGDWLPSVGAAPSTSEEAFTVSAPLLSAKKGTPRLHTPFRDFDCSSLGFMRNLETENQMNH